MKKLFILAPALIFCAPLATALPARAADKTATPVEKSFNSADLFEKQRDAVNNLYKARTGFDAEKYQIVAPERAWLEAAYAPADVARMEAMIADSERVPLVVSVETSALALMAAGGGATDDAEVARLRNLSYESYNSLALARLEKAQFVTNAPADFAAVIQAFDDRNEERKATDIYYDDKSRWRKSGPLMAAHLRALVGGGQLAEAFRIYNLWRAGESEQHEMATCALVEALDMVGDFKMARGAILTSTVAQVQKDGGKYVPANQQYNRLALSIHYRHMNDALNIAPSAAMLPLQRARHAGALMLKREITDADRAFVKAAPASIEAAMKQPAPAATRLLAAQLWLGGADANHEKAENLIESVFQNSTLNTPAFSLKGYFYLVQESMPAALVVLDQAIKSDPIIAYAHDAQRFRMGLYRQTGQPALAEQDQKEIMQLDRLMQQLAGPQ